VITINLTFIRQLPLPTFTPFEASEPGPRLTVFSVGITERQSPTAITAAAAIGVTWKGGISNIKDKATMEG
jgi:hypothetical protein